MNEVIQIKEFDSITCEECDSQKYGACRLTKNYFDELVTFVKEYVSNDTNVAASDFMKIGYKRNVGDIVSFSSYVGLVQMCSGLQIEVLPKIDFYGEAEDKNMTKQVFLRMLRSMKDFPSKVFNDATLNVDKMNLYEIFINMYLQEVRQLVKHGLRSAYVQQEDNLQYYKGKLIVGQHIHANIGHKERFYVSFEEFNQNRSENRLIKASLEKLQKLTMSAENSKEIRQLLVSFEMVEPSKAYEKDFAKVVIDRNSKDYENLMRWSKVFLLDESFSTFSGSTVSRALLFPMEKVFESYVAKNMKNVLGPKGWTVKSQDKGYYLFTEPRNQFALTPDIVLRRDNRIIIMDTKWKKLIDDSGKNYGISQADMYQMYAYSRKYQNPETMEYPEVWLLYPDNVEMKGCGNIAFNSGDGTIVRVWFIDLKNIENNLQELESVL